MDRRAFLPDRIRLRLFKWDVKTQSPDAIDTLEPFHTTASPAPPAHGPWRSESAVVRWYADNLWR